MPLSLKPLLELQHLAKLPKVPLRTIQCVFILFKWILPLFIITNIEVIYQLLRRWKSLNHQKYCTCKLHRVKDIQTKPCNKRDVSFQSQDSFSCETGGLPCYLDLTRYFRIWMLSRKDQTNKPTQEQYYWFSPYHIPYPWDSLSLSFTAKASRSSPV